MSSGVLDRRLSIAALEDVREGPDELLYVVTDEDAGEILRIEPDDDAGDSESVVDAPA